MCQITDLAVSHVGGSMRLMATTNDGRLTAIDVRKNKVLVRSEVGASYPQ